MGTVWRWTPALALMALLFALSAQPDLDTGSGPVGMLVRKIGHAGAFGLLWLLVNHALHGRRPFLATALTLAYAVSDEWHQSFVAGRVGAASDVAIDALGMGIAAGAWVWWRVKARPAVRA